MLRNITNSYSHWVLNDKIALRDGYRLTWRYDEKETIQTASTKASSASVAC